jgi:hypothetical protein
MAKTDVDRIYATRIQQGNWRLLCFGRMGRGWFGRLECFGRRGCIGCN